MSTPTSTVQYLGNLRCNALHHASGQSIISDAPVDNKGKGEAFSPTDLMATSLAMCMLTIMGIAAQEHGITMENIKADVVKKMNPKPRKVGAIDIQISGNFDSWTSQHWEIMKRAADQCPVKLSLHPELKIQLEWISA